MKRNREGKPLSKFSTTLWKIASNLVFILPALLAFALQRVFALFPAFVEDVFATKLFRFLSVPISFLTSLLPFSLTEISLYLSVPALILLTVLLIRQMKRTDSRKKALLKDVRRVGWTLSILYMSFMLLLGFNYTRLPLEKSLRITTSPAAKEDLEKICGILLDQTNGAREECSEENGVMVIREGIDHALKTASAGYDAVSEIYPVLQMTPRRAKSVMISHLWSYTGICGMYFPFFVEANVNTDTPQAFLPNTILHELAHTIGIAREGEANFAAFITGIHHPDPDFRYSSYLSAFLETSNALYSVDKAAYAALMERLSDGAKRDIAANGAYWRQFAGPVQDISSSVNHAYLQSNLQQDGIRSYGEVVDLIIGYYSAG